MSVPSVDVAVVAVAESWPEHGRRERDLPSRAQVHSGGQLSIRELPTLLGKPELRFLFFVLESHSNAKYFRKFSFNIKHSLWNLQTPIRTTHRQRKLQNPIAGREPTTSLIKPLVADAQACSFARKRRGSTGAYAGLPERIAASKRRR